jgi:hypothetical protein
MYPSLSGFAWILGYRSALPREDCSRYNSAEMACIIGSGQVTVSSFRLHATGYPELIKLLCRRHRFDCIHISDLNKNGEP